jgi:uncharacterized alpha-E superfamily protein
MMLSRVAANMYWFARYLERVEDTARCITVNTNLFLDLPKGYAPGWEPLLQITGLMEHYRAKHGTVNEKNTLRFLLGEPDNPSSVLASLASARENLRTTRDMMPPDAWEHLNGLYLFAQDGLDAGLTRRGRYDYLAGIITRVQEITGLLMGTMSHDDAYAFLRIGRNMERADMTSRILDVRSADLLGREDGGAEGASPFTTIQWMHVLRSLSAYEAYRRAVHPRVSAAAALGFLLLNENFPRSVYHAYGVIATSLEGLPRHDHPLRLVRRLMRVLKQADLQHLANDSQARAGYLDDLQRQMGDCHQSLNAMYFLMDQSTAMPSAASGSGEGTQGQSQRQGA